MGAVEARSHKSQLGKGIGVQPHLLICCGIKEPVERSQHQCLASSFGLLLCDGTLARSRARLTHRRRRVVCFFSREDRVSTGRRGGISTRAGGGVEGRGAT